MILCDTGPLVALINTSDPYHARCASALSRLARTQLVTTWPCWAEAMYLLARVGGSLAQDALWELLAVGHVHLHPLDEGWKRMRALMRQYQDAPMDLADASLVVAAEQLGIHRIFTVDHHFYVYRVYGTQAFEVLP